MNELSASNISSSNFMCGSNLDNSDGILPSNIEGSDPCVSSKTRSNSTIEDFREFSASNKEFSHVGNVLLLNEIHLFLPPLSSFAVMREFVIF